MATPVSNIICQIF